MMMRMPSMESLQWLQGSHLTLSKPNRLCLLFQVNCPGCHIHAIPALNELLQARATRMYAEEEKQETTAACIDEISALPPLPDLDIYAISTAFEDFEFNTLGNTKLLVDEHRLVGVSRQRLGEHSETQLTVPVAFDILTPKSDATPQQLADAMDATKSNARDQLLRQMGLPSTQVEQALKQLSPDILPQFLPSTFYAVAAPGTPTWILHDSSGRVLDRVFGTYDATQLATWINGKLAK